MALGAPNGGAVVTDVPSEQPSEHPSHQPSAQPSGYPSYQPSAYPSYQPSAQPSGYPSYQPSGYPSAYPSYQPSGYPSYQPSGYPSGYPSYQPSGYPSYQPSYQPSGYPSYQPSGYPSYQPSGYPSTQPSGYPVPSAAPGAAQLVLSDLKASAQALHLKLEVQLDNPSTQTYALDTAFFQVIVTPKGTGAQANVVRRPNIVAITPGKSGHIIEVEQLDPGDYDVAVSVTDASGNSVSNEVSTAVHEAGHAPQFGHLDPNLQMTADVGITIISVEHVHGEEYRTHYTLRNNGQTAIEPGLMVYINGDEPTHGSASQFYNLQSALAPGATQQHYLTLMLAAETVWTLGVSAGQASDTWTVNIDKAGNAHRTS